MSALIALEVLDDHRQARFPRPVPSPQVPGRDADAGVAPAVRSPGRSRRRRSRSSRDHGRSTIGSTLIREPLASGVIRRLGRTSRCSAATRPKPAPTSSATAAPCCGACSPPPRSRELRAEIDAVFESVPPERVRDDKDEFRYEMLNRSAACQRAIGHPADPRGDRAAPRRRLPRDRQHRVAESAGVPRRLLALRRRPAHPATRRRPVGRPHPVSRCSRSARTSCCRTARSPTGRPRSCPAAIVRAGSRRSTG